jgi:hypothetical protein
VIGRARARLLPSRASYSDSIDRRGSAGASPGFAFKYQFLVEFVGNDGYLWANVISAVWHNNSRADSYSRVTSMAVSGVSKLKLNVNLLPT